MNTLARGSGGWERARQRFFAALALALGCWGPSACSSNGAATNPDSTAPKYYDDVAPVINRSCAGCHRDGGIAPFALTNYDEVHDHASEIASATAARTMPPMPVDNSGACNTYSNARWLSDDEISLLGRWASAGTPVGDPAKAPPLPDAPASLENPDVLLDTGVSYTPNSPDGHDD